MFEIHVLNRQHLLALYGPNQTADERLLNRLRLEWGYGFAGIEGGKVIGAAGLVKLSEGIGSAWTLLTEDIKMRHKLSLHRAVKRLFPIMADMMRFDLVEAAAECQSQINCAWLERLGFAAKGIFLKNGLEYRRYSWVKNG